MRILLVVFQEHVVARPVQLYQSRFKNERFDFRVRDYEFQIRYAANKLARLAVVPAPLLKIGAHTVAQIFSLADVNNFARVVLVQIDSGRCGQNF